MLILFPARPLYRPQTISELQDIYEELTRQCSFFFLFFSFWIFYVNGAWQKLSGEGQFIIVHEGYFSQASSTESSAVCQCRGPLQVRGGVAYYFPIIAINGRRIVAWRLQRSVVKYHPRTFSLWLFSFSSFLIRLIFSVCIVAATSMRKRIWNYRFFSLRACACVFVCMRDNKIPRVARFPRQLLLDNYEIG